MVPAVVVRVYDGPLPAEAVSCFQEGAGAALTFAGLVRPLEDGRLILALDYEVYEPMARRVLEELAGEMLQTHELLGIAVEHSRGRVGVGECSFRLQIAAPHRQEALAAMAEFIKSMKRDVPIWKNVCPLRTLAAILAGGLAARLGGTAKGLLPIPQGTIIERLLAELASAAIDDVIIVANDPQPYAALGKTTIGDLRPRVGPLGGIEAALSYAGDAYDAVLVLPCDLPNVSATEIRRLLNVFARDPRRAAVAVTPDGRQHPLCAVAPVTLLPQVVQSIEAGQYGVGRLWTALAAATVPVADPTKLYNINTPQDLNQLPT
jgi:molybdopterin-guanine dinucleotide biosynthesis protein A